MDNQLTGLVGLLAVLAFGAMIIIFRVMGRNKPPRPLRDIPAFGRLARAVGLTVEAGQRLHISLGWGGLNGLAGASAMVGLTVLQRITRASSISDRPIVATSGEGAISILTRDSLRGAYRAAGAENRYLPTSGQVAGLTPLSYAVGTLPVIYDQQVSATFMAGHFNGEAALITDAAERSGGLTLAGSDSLPGQAVLYATAQEPLIGEELYAAGAYVQAGPAHSASLQAQDWARWALFIVILAGAIIKFLIGDL